MSVASGGIVPKSMLGFGTDSSRLSTFDSGGPTWFERLCVDCPLTGEGGPVACVDRPLPGAGGGAVACVWTARSQVRGGVAVACVWTAPHR